MIIFTWNSTILSKLVECFWSFSTLFNQLFSFSLSNFSFIALWHLLYSALFIIFEKKYNLFTCMWILYWILQQNWKKKLELLLHVGNALISYFKIYCMIQSHKNEKKKKMIMTSSTIDIFAHFHIENYTLLKHSISWHCSLNHRTFVFFPIDLNLASGMTGLKINAIGSLGWRLYMPIGWKNIQGYTWSDNKHSPSKPSSPSHIQDLVFGVVVGFWMHQECNNIGNINWNNWATKV